MRITGLDGRSYAWNPVDNGPSSHNSAYHVRARALLSRLFPADRILEEVSLPGSGGLRCDFCLPTRRMVVEVHGEQHYDFSAFFHETRLDFMRGVARDRRKAEWCVLNQIALVELPHYEPDEQWSRRIVGAGKAG